MSTTKPIPTQFQALDGGFRLGDWEFVRQAILNLNSANSTYGITAAGTTQATATQLGAALNQVDTVAGSTGVNLPLSTGKHNTPCQFCVLINNGANTLQVYGAQSSSDTINGVAAGTGISMPASSYGLFVTVKGGAWFLIAQGGAASLGNITVTGISNSGNFTETTVGSGFVQKAGTNGRAGTFSLNGTTTVTISNTTVALTDFIGISLNTEAGAFGAQPHVVSISAGVFFTVVGTASDTSLYNYTMIGIN